MGRNANILSIKEVKIKNIIYDFGATKCNNASLTDHSPYSVFFPCVWPHRGDSSPFCFKTVFVDSFFPFIYWNIMANCKSLWPTSFGIVGAIRFHY